MDDDQQKLLDIEQNIANLEKSFSKGENEILFFAKNNIEK